MTEELAKDTLTNEEDTSPTQTLDSPETTAVKPMPEKKDSSDADIDDPKDSNAQASNLNFKDVRRMNRIYLKERFDILKASISKHRISAVLFFFGCIAILAFLGLAFSKTRLTPSTDYIKQDAQDRVIAPQYSGGTYGSDSHLVLREVEVRSVNRTSTAVESSAAQFGASAYATAEVMVVYSNNSVRAEKTVSLGYASLNEQWQPIGEETNAQIAWTALSGVDQSKVISSVSALLTEAETGFVTSEKTGAVRDVDLAELYKDAEISIVSQTFDEEAQTDTLTISCINAGLYETYNCLLTVEFSFSPASGEWSVASISASDDAKTRNFETLCGTWEGTFQSQSSDTTRCLGAKEAGLSLTITESGGSGGTSWVKGYVSGLAHYHTYPDSDIQSSAGDEIFKEVNFTATFIGGYNQETQSELAFVATLPEDINGTVTLTLGFGTESDASRIVANVKTTYPYTETFLFITSEKSAVYNDLFLLTKSD